MCEVGRGRDRDRESPKREVVLGGRDGSPHAWSSSCCYWGRRAGGPEGPLSGSDRSPDAVPEGQTDRRTDGRTHEGQTPQGLPGLTRSRSGKEPAERVAGDARALRPAPSPPAAARRSVGGSPAAPATAFSARAILQPHRLAPSRQLEARADCGRGHVPEGRGYQVEGRGNVPQGRGYTVEGRGSVLNGRGYVLEGRGNVT